MSEAVEQIQFVAYNVAFIIIAIGILGNILSLVVLTRPNMKVRIIFGFSPPRIRLAESNSSFFVFTSLMMRLPTPEPQNFQYFMTVKTTLTLCILKRVMYVNLFWLTVSNLCALITAIPAFFDGCYGFGGSSYITAFYQVGKTFSLLAF